jgi:hypothetical protein
MKYHSPQIKSQPPEKGAFFMKVILAFRKKYFRVQPAGRAKVLKEKRKNVHAFVCGQLVETYGEVLRTSPCVNGLWGGGKKIFSTDFQVVYNPYKYKTFIKGSGESIFETYKYTLINNKEIWVGDWIPALTM